MNYDPISYLMQRESLRTDREHLMDQEILRNQIAIGDHEKRIASLELWRTYLMSQLRKWPYLAIPAILLLLNVAPKETVALLTAIIEAAG